MKYEVIKLRFIIYRTIPSCNFEFSYDEWGGNDSKIELSKLPSELLYERQPLVFMPEKEVGKGKDFERISYVCGVRLNSVGKVHVA